MITFQIDGYVLSAFGTIIAILLGVTARLLYQILTKLSDGVDGLHKRMNTAEGSIRVLESSEAKSHAHTDKLITVLSGLIDKLIEKVTIHHDRKD